MHNNLGLVLMKLHEPTAEDYKDNDGEAAAAADSGAPD